MNRALYVFHEVLTEKQWLSFQRFLRANSQPIWVRTPYALVNWCLLAITTDGHIRPWVIVGRTRIELIINRLHEEKLIDDQERTMLLSDFTQTYEVEVEKGK